jgi:hypothetical protein
MAAAAGPRAAAMSGNTAVQRDVRRIVKPYSPLALAVYWDVVDAEAAAAAAGVFFAEPYETAEAATAAAARRNGMALCVEALTGQRMYIAFSNSATALDAKHAITRLSHIPVDQQRLLSAGQQLDDTRLLAPMAGTVMHLVLRFRGGYGKTLQVALSPLPNAIVRMPDPFESVAVRIDPVIPGTFLSVVDGTYNNDPQQLPGVKVVRTPLLFARDMAPLLRLELRIVQRLFWRVVGDAAGARARVEIARRDEILGVAALTRTHPHIFPRPVAALVAAALGPLASISLRSRIGTFNI